MSKKKIKVIIGILLVLGIAIALFVSVSSENLTYFHTIEEVFKQPEKFKNKTIRIMGLVEEGSVTWQPKFTKLNFRITEDSKQFLNVEYYGSRPDMFKEGRGVVVEGVLGQSNLFQANKLLVKHTEEYKSTSHTDEKDYFKSIQ